MKSYSYSISKRDELRTQISSVTSPSDGTQGTDKKNSNPNQQKVNELRTINEFYAAIQNSSETKFQDIVNKTKQLIANSHSIYHPCLNALKDSLKDLAKQDLTAVNLAKAPKPKQWQYRYALALGLLEDYQQFIKTYAPDLEPSFKSSFAGHTDVISPEEAASLPHAPSSDLETDKNLFQKAVELKLISHHRITRQEAILKSVLIKTEYDKQLAEFEKELSQLRLSATADGSLMIPPVCDYGDRFIESLKNDIDKTISYQTANEALTETRSMIRELNSAVTRDTSPKARIDHQNKANKHANQLVKLTDKRKDVGSSWWKWALLIASMTVFTFAILALVAASHGTFLGMSFSTGSMVTLATGATKFVPSAARTGALFSGIFGVASSPMYLGGSLALFFCNKPNKVKEQAQKLVAMTKKALAEEKLQPAEPVALRSYKP